jgi:hypothetical protein
VLEYGQRLQIENCKMQIENWRGGFVGQDGILRGSRLGIDRERE